MSVQRWRDLDGIVLLDKSGGMTSNQALQRVRRLFNARKAGHTGSLDPLATGMLPVCFGQATKISGLLLDARKRYRVVARLGQATDTADADGAVVAEAAVPEFSVDDVERTLCGFRGELEQVPPMYSALKQQGRRLYALARTGQNVERAARRVRIDELRLEALSPGLLTLEVLCSKGTYVRTLVEDVAVALGTLAHVAELRRLAVEPFEGEAMLTLDAMQQLAPDALAGLLLPVCRALVGRPALTVSSDQAGRLLNGQWLDGLAPPCTGQVMLYTDQGGFIGLGEATASGQVIPRRMFPRLGSTLSGTST